MVPMVQPHLHLHLHLHLQLQLRLPLQLQVQAQSRAARASAQFAAPSAAAYLHQHNWRQIAHASTRTAGSTCLICARFRWCSQEMTLVLAQVVEVGVKGERVEAVEGT